MADGQGQRGKEKKFDDLREGGYLQEVVLEPTYIQCPLCRYISTFVCVCACAPASIHMSVCDWAVWQVEGCECSLSQPSPDYSAPFIKVSPP